MAYFWFIFLIISLAINGILYWYIKKLMKQFQGAIESVSNIQERIDEYIMHLETVFNMETYYGDTTIENLLKHSKDVSDSLKEGGNRFSVSGSEETVNET